MSATMAVRDLLEWLRGNPAYLAAVSTSYGQVVMGMVIQLALVPWYLAHLDTFRFGVLMMLLSFVNFAAIGIGWISGGMQRLFGEAYAARNEPRFAQIYAVSRWIFVGYALLIGLAAVAASETLSETIFRAVGEQEQGVVGGIVGAAAYLVVLYAFSVDRVALTARGRAAAANLLFILSQAVTASLILPVLWFGGDLLHVMLCFAAGAVVSLLAARLLWLRASMRLSWLVRPDMQHRALLGRLLGRMGFGYLWVGLMTLALQADVLIVGVLAGPEVAAHFVLVWRLAELVVIALWRLPEAFQPFAIHLDVRRDSSRLERSYWVMVVLMMVTGAAAGSGYALFGHHLVSWWVGLNQAPDDRVAYALAGVSIFWLCLARTPVVFGYAVVRLRMLSLLLTGELLVKLVIIWFLLPVYGYYTPLVAINIVHIGGLAVAYQFFGRHLIHAPSSIRSAGQLV